MHLTQGAVTNLALAAVILYLGAHGVTGRQGLVSYMALQEKEAALQEEREALEARVADLKSRAERLRTESPAFDRDYLEERARDLLDAMHADEQAFDLDAREFALLP